MEAMFQFFWYDSTVDKRISSGLPTARWNDLITTPSMAPEGFQLRKQRMWKAKKKKRQCTARHNFIHCYHTGGQCTKKIKTNFHFQTP